MIGGVLNVIQRQRVPFGSGGPIASLDLDFAAGTYLSGSGSYAFQDLIRFSRTSAGTFTGSNGLIQNSPISNNLLLWTEEAENAAWTKTAVAVQSNLLTYSEQFDNAAWTKGNATVTANTTVAPDGLTSGDTITGVTAGVSNFIRPTTLPIAVATQYTFSIWVRAGTTTTCSLLIRDNTAATNLAVTSQIVSGPGSISGSPIVNVTGLSATEWTRVAITLSAPATAGNALQPTFYPETALSSTTAQSNIIWGAQFVQGALPADYQPTVASAVAIQHLAPNGVLSANKIIENSANTYHFVRNPVTAANAAHTFTVYLKAGERTRVVVAMTDIATGDAFIGVDLTNGTTFTATGLVAGSWTSISSSVTSVGDGWYRVRVTATKGAGTQIAGCVFPTNGTSATFLGDGSSGFYMWGAQLEVGSSASAYTRNADGLYGPRFDYDPVTLENKGLLIEEARTNLVTYSEQIDDASWTKTNATVTANATTAPDGTSNADKLIATATANVHETVKALTGLSASTTYTISVYLKAAEQTWAYVNFLHPTVADYRTYFDLSNGTVGTNPAGSTATITPVGNGWYRCTVTRTTVVGQTAVSVVVAGTTANNTNIYSGNGTNGIFVWGAQLEAGAFVTSYIPTVASTVTRAADIALITGGAFSPWYNGAEGSLLLEGSVQFGSTRYFFTGVAAQRMAYGISGGSVGIYDGTNAALSVSGVPSGQTFKLATAYSDLTGLAGSVNGSAVFASSAYTGSFASMTSVGLFNVAAGNAPTTGYIRSIGYYNTRLTDAQLQALTT